MKVYQRLQNFFARTRLLWLLAALLVCLAGMAGWIYLHDVRTAADKIRVERQNEDYSTVTEPLGPDDEIRQPFVTDEPVFGGSFIFTIYDQVCYGTVTVELQDESGAVLASVTKDTTQLLDNTYQDLVFDHPVYPEGKTTYAYVIRFAPGEGGGQLGLWCSEDTAEGYLPLSRNGAEQAATLGFSIVTNRVGDWIKTVYWGFVAFAAAALVLGWWLLAVRRVPLTGAFVYLALVLGVLFLFVMPPYIAPDEEVHIHSAYELSNTMLGVENGERLIMRADDAVTFDHSDKVSAFSYQTYAAELFGRCEDTRLVQTDYITADVFFLQYLPQAIGITLGRLLGLNYVTLILLGRIANLLTYVALMALALHIMPRYERILACVGLLPMCLHLAASFNYDAMLIGMASLFYALVLDYACVRPKLRWRDLALLAVVIVLMAPMKMLYVLLVAFCLIIPARKCPGKVRYLLIGLGALAVVFAVCFAPYIIRYIGVTPESLAEAANKVVAPVNPLNVDYVETEFWNLSYVLTHIPGTLKLIAHTIQENTWLYMTQLVGGELGEPILNDLIIWTPAVLGLWLILLLAAVPQRSEEPLLSGRGRVWGGLVLLGLCGALLIVVLGWTPLRNDLLWGLQGRYLLPAVPLALLVCQGRNLQLEKGIDRQLLGSEALLGLIAAASVFQAILGQSVQ